VSSQPEPALALLQSGEEFFPALIAAIDGATQWVQLETYIFNLHGAGLLVAEALVRAAERGVSVQVLVDGIGTEPLSHDWQIKFSACAIEWCVYSPLVAGLGSLAILVPDSWRRLHRKLCVVDQRLLFCGGINVLDDFYDPNYGDLTHARFDFAMAATGPLVAEAVDAMALLWWRVKAGYSARQRHLSAAWERVKAAGYGGRVDASALPARRPATARKRGLVAQPEAKAVLVLRDNLRNRGSIEKAYLRAINNSRQEVLIANAYFLPGGRLRRALVRAARRGVKVTLLLQGRYEYFMPYHAARPVYDKLLSVGIELYEYEQSFLHAKVAVVDGHWATVGSSNLDPLSLLLAREANVVVEDDAFAADLRTRLLSAIAGQGRRIDAASYGQRPLGQRVLGRIAYALMRLAIFITGQRY
jgi:cardiolipin synthase